MDTRRQGNRARKIRNHAATPKATEKAIQAACLDFLRMHPRIAWIERMNVGATKVEDDSRKRGYRYVAFGFPGCSDLIGQTKAGRFLAIEVKRPGEWPKAETFARWERAPRLDSRQRRLIAQRAFLATVRRHGGISGIADSLEACAEIVREA